MYIVFELAKISTIIVGYTRSIWFINSLSRAQPRAIDGVGACFLLYTRFDVSVAVVSKAWIFFICRLSKIDN